MKHLSYKAKDRLFLAFLIVVGVIAVGSLAIGYAVDHGSCEDKGGHTVSQYNGVIIVKGVPYPQYKTKCIK